MNKRFSMIKIGTKLRQIAAARGLADAEVARRVGISAERYGNYVRAVRQPDFDTLIAICKVLDITPNHLFDLGDGSSLPSPRVTADRNEVVFGDESYVLVPVYDMRDSTGVGLTPGSNSTLPQTNFFRLDWLRRVTSAPPDQLAVIRVRGDSMWDTLHDGDHVLIDRTQVSLRKEGLFVLDVAGEVYLKRCSYRPDTNRITMRSDNPAYPTWDAIDPDTVTVFGRVLWLGRYLG